ncbi:MAG: glutamine phosphoribosylpyrophosphate amidotransferase [Ardenticatenaceae bacterium]
MCGIAGYLDKTNNDQAHVGQILYKMLDALGLRGPDSAGVAVYDHRHDGDLVLRVKLGEFGDKRHHAREQASFIEKGNRITQSVAGVGTIGHSATTGEYLRLFVDYAGTPRELEEFVESLGEEAEVVSMGKYLEIIKQVGSPDNLEEAYDISSIVGTHGIGHTRLSTESRIDLSHSQPFWVHGYPDIATVHNGHITNYDKMRRRYEQKGVKFYTHNDSEVIGIYFADKLSQGMSLEEIMWLSLDELDGSYSYFVSTPDAMGFVRDPFALKPLLYTETDTFVAMANEEQAIRAAIPGDYLVREAQAREVQLWQR